MTDSNDLPLVVGSATFRRKVGDMVRESASGVRRILWLGDSRSTQNTFSSGGVTTIQLALGGVNRNLPESTIVSGTNTPSSPPFISGYWGANIIGGLSTSLVCTGQKTLPQHVSYALVRRTPPVSGTNGMYCSFDPRMTRASGAGHIADRGSRTLWDMSATMGLDAFCIRNPLNDPTLQLRWYRKTVGAVTTSSATLLQTLTATGTDLANAVFDCEKLSFTGLTVPPLGEMGLGMFNTTGSNAIEMIGFRATQPTKQYGLCSVPMGAGGYACTSFGTSHSECFPILRTMGPYAAIVISTELNDCFGALLPAATFKTNLRALTALARAWVNDPTIPVIYLRYTPHGTNFDSAATADRTALWQSYGGVGEELSQEDPNFGMCNSLPFLEATGFNPTDSYFTGLSDGGVWASASTYTTSQYALHGGTYWRPTVTTIAGEEPGSHEKWLWIGHWAPADPSHPRPRAMLMCADMFVEFLQECRGFTAGRRSAPKSILPL